MGHFGSYADFTVTAVVHVTLHNQKLGHLHYTPLNFRVLSTRTKLKFILSLSVKSECLGFSDLHSVLMLFCFNILCGKIDTDYAKSSIVDYHA